MTPVDFRLYMKGFQRRRLEDVETLQAGIRQDWEMTRMQTLALLNVQLSRKDQIRRPDQLWKFPWDTATRGVAKNPLSRDQAHTIVERYRKLGIVT